MQRSRAFTLIELLVTISIIGALIGILVPAMSGARSHALRLTCQTRLHEVARAVWEYSVANDSRVPYVESPLNNRWIVGNGATDAQFDPYDRENWSKSLQNVLMPLYLGEDPKVFTCPAAIIGWPRNGALYKVTYRDAGANQPNGILPTLDPSEFDYFREAFGFLDGRPMNEMRYRSTGNLISDAMSFGASRGTYVRDMVLREGRKVTGPHGRGINAVNREFGVEFRDFKTIQQDLAPSGRGVLF